MAHRQSSLRVDLLQVAAQESSDGLIGDDQIDHYTLNYPTRDGCTAYEAPSESGRPLKVILNESWPRAALLVTAYPP